MASFVSAHAGRSGATVVMVFDDDPTYSAGAPTISVNGGGAETLTNGSKVRRANKFIWLSPVSIANGDTVTVTWADSVWSDVGAGSAETVTTDQVGVKAGVPPTSVSTTIAATNIEELNYWRCGGWMFADVMLHARTNPLDNPYEDAKWTEFTGGSSEGVAPDVDDHGNVTAINVGDNARVTISSGGDPGSCGYACTIRLVWSEVGASSGPDIVGLTASDEDTTGGIKWREYECTTAQLNATRYIQVQDANVRNLRAYVDPSKTVNMTTGLPKRHLTDRGLEIMDYVSCIRLMDFVDTNNSNVRTMADVLPYNTPKGGCGFSSGFRVSVTDIADGDATWSDTIWNFSKNIVVTTDGAHGLQTGDVIYMEDSPSGILNGGDIDKKYVVYVPDGETTTFVVRHNNTGGTWDFGVDMTGASVYKEIVQMVHPRTVCDVCNDARADAYVTVPFLATDELYRELATFYAKHLRGKLYIEKANEIWNASFAAYAQRMALSRDDPTTTGLGSTPINRGDYWWAERANRMFEIFREVYAAYGRDPDTEIVRVLAAQATDDTTLDEVLEWFNNDGDIRGAEASAYEFDAIAIAPYFGESLTDTDEEDFGDNADVEQFADMVEEFLSFAGGNMTDWATVASTESVDLIAYEGGWHVIANNAATELNVLKLARHPRSRDMHHAYWALWEAAGGKLFCYYTLSHRWDDAANGVWGMIQNFGQKPGIGDGSDGQHDNTGDLEEDWDDNERTVAPRMRAFEEWGSHAKVRRRLV